MQKEHQKKLKKSHNKVFIIVCVILVIVVGYFLYTYSCEGGYSKNLLFIEKPTEQLAGQLSEIYANGLDYSPDTDTRNILGF